MRVKVLFFASARELTGETETWLDLEEGAKTDSIPTILMGIYPDLDMNRDRMSIAINQTYCRESVQLKEGDVIAILPPISGG